MTTENENTVLRFLTKHFDENYSINQLAKQVNLTPMGLLKLLRRLEQKGIVRKDRVANADVYHVNFKSDIARKSAELALFEEIRQPFAKAQAKDLERLRPEVKAAILFGSVLIKGDKANDIDVLVVFHKKDYAAFQKKLRELQKIKTKRINPVMQTAQDLINNLKKKDKIVLDALKTGKILWGQQEIVEAIYRVAE